MHGTGPETSGPLLAAEEIVTFLEDSWLCLLEAFKCEYDLIEYF